MGYARTIPNVYVEYAGQPNKANQIIGSAPTSVGLGQIVLPSNLQGSIYQAYLDVIITSLQDTSGGANKLNGDQYIVIYVNSDWAHKYNAIKLQDDALEVDANQTVPYGRIYGHYDLSTYIKAGDTIDVYLDSGLADADTLRVRGSQVIVRLILGD